MCTLFSKFHCRFATHRLWLKIQTYGRNYCGTVCFLCDKSLGWLKNQILQSPEDKMLLSVSLRLMDISRTAFKKENTWGVLMLHVMKSFTRAKKNTTLLFWTQVYIETFHFKSIGLPHISIYWTKDRNNLVSWMCCYHNQFLQPHNKFSINLRLTIIFSPINKI